MADTDVVELRHRLPELHDALTTMAAQAGVDPRQFVDDLLDSGWLMNALRLAADPMGYVDGSEAADLTAAEGEREMPLLVYPVPMNPGDCPVWIGQPIPAEHFDKGGGSV